MENSTNWEEQRNQIIGLGENSFKKSYYPELQLKIAELETAYSNLNTIFNTINDGIVIHDEEGKILLLNSQSEKIFNIQTDEKDQFSIFDFSSKKIDSEKLTQIWADVLNGNPRTIDWIIQQNRTSVEIPVQISINSTIWYSKKAIVAVIRDITDRKQFENELIKAKEKAEENDRLKTAFLQNMSHEIRTPMNAICGFSNLLNEPDLADEKKKKFIAIIQNSSKQLLSIVTDILTISSLETKQEKVNIQQTNINSIILELYSIFNQQATNQNILLRHTEQLSDKQAETVTDGTKLTQVLTNLLTNALKFTHTGSIEFGYSTELIDNLPFLKFYVKDTGIGISPTLHEKIFERFRQADTSISRTYGGTGLGLSISKAFVELLGGSIWLESEPENGSTFYFTIPYNPVNVTDSTSSDTQIKLDTNYSTIIIAEDEEYNYLYIKELLSRHDFKLIRAKNGYEAIEFWKQNPDTSLILMDIKMPIMDGYTAAKLIKEIKPDLPIIAQSAYALENEIELFKSVFDGYLTKPINANDLNSIIQRFK
ncbi:hypothetical protein CYCD_25800 [Tenuifilaceae bacterium CYCD]|nr:hypothetical protein CYCD_25800 [Tenuifilaceae bacterium CYCD]